MTVRQFVWLVGLPIILVILYVVNSVWLAGWKSFVPGAIVVILVSIVMNWNDNDA